MAKLWPEILPECVTFDVGQNDNQQVDTVDDDDFCWNKFGCFLLGLVFLYAPVVKDAERN